MRYKYVLTIILSYLLTSEAVSVKAQQDTISVMAYNVLNFGDGCQGSTTFLMGQLKTIIQYANPDVIGLVKMSSIGLSPTNTGILPYGYADTIIKYSLDAAFPLRYKYCALTNQTVSNNMDVLFYNQNKFGFVWVKTLLSSQEDFDLYKLYYKDPFLSTTHDSTFLYFILNHTISGTSSTGRDQQDTLIIDQLQNIFYHLPNLISMGDFNTRNSSELGYQRYIANSDTNFLCFDPPFNPDNNIAYPKNWDLQPSLSADYLNTTTRLSTSPNSCGTTGGAKDWYEHTFVSNWIIHNIDYVKYIPNSYVTLGNDGHRVGISENDSSSVRNNSAPSNVVNAIFQFSDKYPIMIKLGLTHDSLGNGPPNPVINGAFNIVPQANKVAINNPVSSQLVIHFGQDMVGEKCEMSCFDILGRSLFTNEFTINTTTIYKDVDLNPGTYLLRLQTASGVNVFHLVKM